MDDLHEMLEHYRITRLIRDYCRSCDRLDAVRMAGVYATVSWDDHGLRKMPGPQYVREVMPGRIGTDEVVSHHLGQTVISLRGESAGAESYFIATMGTHDDEGRSVIHQLGGRYVDELIREDGNWKIKKRVTLRDWSITLPVEQDWMAGRCFVAGRADGSDPSFSALGIDYRGFEGLL